MSKKAIITGINGQDGSYLVENLLSKDYQVIGLYRRSSTNTLGRVQHLLNHPGLILKEFDLTDPSGCVEIISDNKPDEFYNLAAQSHVGTSFKQPSSTFEINALGVVNLLEAIRLFSPSTKFYQASTSEMFGSNYSEINGLKFQNENTELIPQSPYAVAKLAAHRMVQIYRKAYNLFCCSGILFNHESPRRGENFVTRKITNYIGQLVNNKINNNTKLKLGNIDAVRDWGHAKDYVEAMRLMLNIDTPDDYVISTGECYSVKNFLEIAFSLVGLDYNEYIQIDPELYRPAEVVYLRGDSTKAKTNLQWNLTMSFNDLIKDMVQSDIEAYKIVT